MEVTRGKLTNTVNGDTLPDPLVDLVHHGRDLAPAGVVEVVVVNVQLRRGIREARGAEGDADVGLAEDVGEGRAANCAVVVESFVYDVLCIVSLR